jgi:hypothetical protein
MKNLKKYLFVLSFLFCVPFSYAVEGCCSYHGGVCGWSCCDGTEVPVWSDACVYAPMDYYQDLLNKCRSKEQSLEDAINVQRNNIDACYFYGRSESTCMGIQTYIDEYKSELSSTKNLCQQINDEYQYGLGVNNEEAQREEEKNKIRDEIEQGNNPCHSGYAPFEGECVAESDICVDVTHGYYDWENRQCMCDEGYYWDTNRCSPAESLCSGNTYWSSISNACISKCGTNSYATANNECRCKHGYTWRTDSENDFNCIKIKEETEEKTTIKNNDNKEFESNLIKQETTSYEFKDLRFKKIEDFKVFAKKNKKRNYGYNF